MAQTARAPRSFGIFLALLALLWLLPLPAAALSILPGQSLEVDFSLSGPAPSADVVTFLLDPTTTSSGVTGMSVSLYDGSTLLASRSGSLSDLTAFVAPGSAWTTNAVSADLSSVQDGSITGRIVATPSFDGLPGDALDAVFYPFSGLVVGQATGSNSLIPLGSGSILVTRTAAVPEPQPIALLASAALLGAAVTRRRGTSRG